MAPEATAGAEELPGDGRAAGADSPLNAESWAHRCLWTMLPLIPAVGGALTGQTGRPPPQPQHTLATITVCRVCNICHPQKGDGCLWLTLAECHC